MNSMNNNTLTPHNNVLIIGDADSIWIKTIIERTLIPYGDNVSILSDSNCQFKDFYSQNNIIVHQLKSVKSLLGPFNFLHNIKCVKKPYDIIIVHFVQPHRSILASIGKYFSKKLILVFWGSDILRAKKSKFVEGAIKKSNNMVIGTEEMIERFHAMYGNEYDNKIQKVNFGANGIEILNESKYDDSSLRKKYGIDDDKTVISIGYSKSYSQQHLKVLRTIEKLPDEVRHNVHIILRLTYGSGNKEYVNEIKECVNSLGCKNTIFETYLSDEEIAEITSLTDIFIHAQITDARSASMCEHLFAGALVIVPSWINYDIEDKVFYLKYGSFEELEKVLSSNIVQKSDSPHRELLLKNRNKIYEICSWNALAVKWRNLYDL